jgi:hypothetical protein
MTIPIDAVWLIAAGWTIADWVKAWWYESVDHVDLWLIDRVVFCGTLTLWAWFLS